MLISELNFLRFNIPFSNTSMKNIGNCFNRVTWDKVRDLLEACFLVNFAKFLNTFLYGTTLVATSKMSFFMDNISESTT